ncbi:MAG TPA: DHH family phosphoesterase [Nitrososphaeraceae archaeon]|nr:DHH family phosphoesterase [Nitrososphaeraceae archaeon]
MSSVVCLSHREDVDGILSAALIKAVSKTQRIQIVLADYANIISKLQKISAAASDATKMSNINALSISQNGASLSDRRIRTELLTSNLENANPDTKQDSNKSTNNSGSGSIIIPTSTSTSTSTTSSTTATANSGIGTGKPQRLFICDLGLSKKTEDKFLGLLKEITSKGIKVTYFDHHDINDELRKKLKKTGVTLIHSVEECTSVQIYNKYKNKLDSHAAFFAASAALTDYMECRPLASAIMSRYDRQFLMLEATALSYMISSNQHNEEFLVNAVNTLSEMKYPHEIEGGFAIAERYVKKVADGVRIVQDSIAVKKKVAYTQSISDLSASVIVNFVLGISEKPVAMVYRLKDDINSYIISIRASKACNVHLGRIVNEVASNLGGSGGGHEKACGAVIPKDKLEEFINAIDKHVGK